MISERKLAALRERLERRAKARPSLYSFQVWALVVLGYAAVAAATLLCLAISIIIAVLIASKNLTSAAVILLLVIGLPLLALFFSLLRSQWIRLPPPVGKWLEPAEYPDLYRRLNEIERTIDGRGPDFVFLDASMNVGVVHYPLVSFLPWFKSFLVMGLPLMLSTAPREFEGILAHELGHLSRRQGRLSTWVSRARQIWSRISDELDGRRSPGAWLLSRFLEWYGPVFATYTFVKERIDEFQADRIAADTVGARSVADGLVRTGISLDYLEEDYWPQMWKRSWHEAEPPVDVYEQLRERLRAGGEAMDASRRTKMVLALPRVPGVPHPSTRERVEALGEEPRVPPPFAESAAERFLGEKLDEHLSACSAEWKTFADGDWQKLREAHEHNVTRLRELEGNAAPGLEELWEKAFILDVLDRHEEALAAHEAVLAVDGDHLLAKYSKGKLLLERGDAAGIDWIETAAQTIPEAAVRGYRRITRFCAMLGDGECTARYAEMAVAAEARLHAVMARGLKIEAGDRFEPPAVSAEALETLAQIFREFSKLRAVYVLRKEDPGFPGRDFHMIVLDYSRPLAALRRPQHLGDAIPGLQEALPKIPLPHPWGIRAIHGVEWVRTVGELVPGTRLKLR